MVENLPSEETLSAVFDDTKFLPSAQALATPTSFERISLVRANYTLASHNGPRPEDSGLRQYALRVFLEELEGFDLVLIDCPPNLYQCSWTAMLAADFVVIPIPPEES